MKCLPYWRHWWRLLIKAAIAIRQTALEIDERAPAAGPRQTAP
jgi:hypothetical protein